MPDSRNPKNALPHHDHNSPMFSPASERTASITVRWRSTPARDRSVQWFGGGNGSGTPAIYFPNRDIAEALGDQRPIPMSLTESQSAAKSDQHLCTFFFAVFLFRVASSVLYLHPLGVALALGMPFNWFHRKPRDFGCSKPLNLCWTGTGGSIDSAIGLFCSGFMPFMTQFRPTNSQCAQSE